MEFLLGLTFFPLLIVSGTILLTLSACARYDTYWPSSVLMISAIIVCGITYGPIVTLSWIFYNFHLLLLGFLIYMIIGAPWAIRFRWAIFVRQKVADQMDIMDRNKSYIPDKIVWSNYVDTISCWWIWWPIDLLGYVLGEWIWNCVSNAVKMFGTWLQNVVNREAASLNSRVEARRAELEKQVSEGRYGTR